MTLKAVRATAAYVALNAAHEVGDYWVQVDRDAVAKGGHGAEGRAACARHVASYTATQAIALAAADRVLGLRLHWGWAAAGLTVSALTHYAADRSGGRWREEGPSTRLVRFARRTGHTGWLERDPGAGPLMDQAWHKGWIAVAAVVAAGGGR
ncbi:hypothetical protein ABZ329_29125 [Streptomyces rubiginosohelvolus]|uniref:hypothetical protein n=1 Tax=Streptomyces rubiginosohelvolus TaxID=67362 RepID=UPI003411BA4B